MPTLFLMCGLPGSGKTTLARQLEREHAALRFTPDDWLSALSLDPHDPSKRSAVESIQWSTAERALELGFHVVVDFGVWSRLERDKFRHRASLLGARTEIRFLDAPRHELLKRLAQRASIQPPGSVHVSEEQLDEYIRLFEPPGHDELSSSDAA